MISQEQQQYRQQNHPSIPQEHKKSHQPHKEIRKKAVALEKCNWTIIFTWIKAHAGIYGNKLADVLAKEAARNDAISFNRIPKSEIVQQARPELS